MSESDLHNLDELIATNPGVDRSLLDRGQEAIKALRAAGIERPAYDIDSPYERQPVEAAPKVGDEPLVVAGPLGARSSMV